MKIKTNLRSGTVTVLLVSLIAFSMMARAQDALPALKQDFEDSARWVDLPTGYKWLEKGGVSEGASIVIERENKSSYGTFGILKLTNPEPGTYRVSADMKVEELGDGGAAGMIYIDLYQESQYVPIKPNSFSSGPTAGAWVKVEGEVVIPAGITQGWVGATIPKGSTGKVSIDNVVFQKVK